MDLTSAFNVAVQTATYAAYASAAVLPILGTYWAWTKGPRQLVPENGTARVVTARHWPNVFNKDKIVARDGAKMYMKWGASDISDVPLSTFRVPIERKGKDSALTLLDKVKAEVNAEFFVRVDTSSDQSIIQALESLGGEIDEGKIKEYCTAKFDAALRAAAAKMEIEQIQTERENFRASVKEALDSLKDDGLILVDVSLRQLNQSPLEDFDPNNFFDAQGLRKVTQFIEDSKKNVNDTKQEAATQIRERNKQEEIKRLKIEEEQKEATLAQQERIKNKESEQAKRIAEITARTRQESEMARITSEKTVEVAEEHRQKEIAVAREERTRVTEEAQIARKVALHGKAGEEADAEKLANEKRAEAVAAAEAVTTERAVAEANRAKQIDVITATAAAEKTAATDRTAADTRLYVAQKGTETAKVEAEALKIESLAAKEAAEQAAEGAYAEVFKKLKAVADGKSEDAKAQESLNEALSKLSPEAMKHLQDLARISVTPEAIRESMKAVEKISAINITSMDGMSGVFGGAAANQNGNGNGGVIAADPNNPMGQVVNAIMSARMAEPLLARLISSVGGDPAIAKNVPGISPGAMPTPPAPLAQPA